MLARLIRAPAVHFVALGGLLFLANSWWQGWSEDRADAAPRETIVITADQIRRISDEHLAENGVRPTAEELAVAVDDAIDEEVLFQKARAIGLDRGNMAVRNRLVQIARFVSEDPNQDDAALYQTALDLGLDRSDTVVRRQLAMLMRLAAANAPIAGEKPPSDAELEAYLNQHREQFMRPWRVRLSHVYLSEDQRGAEAEADAQRLLGKLRATSLEPEAAVELGDPFLLGNHLKWQTRQGLQKDFGERFADAVAKASPGSWSGPFRSAYGWHLVWIHEVQPPRLPALAAVRHQVLRAVLEARSKWRVDETLKALRANYTIKVEMPVAGVANSQRANEHG